MSSTQEIERRIFNVESLEVRLDGEGVEPKIIGYASVFNEPTLIVTKNTSFQEQVAPGAFARAIVEDDVRALVNHDPNYVLGRNKAETLAMHEDEHGLRVTIQPPATQWATDLLTSMDRGDINQMSFGFVVRDEEWSTENEQVLRTLKDVELFDVSVVTYPAYSQTSAAVRDKATAYSQAAQADDKSAAEAMQAQSERRKRKIIIAKEKVL